MRSFNPVGLFPPRNPQYEFIMDLANQYTEIELEIGAGQGDHSFARALSQPQKLIIGVERTRNKFLMFNKLHQSKTLPNLIAVNADIVPWLTFLNKDILFSKIWILYPNPEIKSNNRRWIKAPFFCEIIKRLKPHAEIEMATNLEEYAVEVRDLSFKNWGLYPKINKYNGPARTQFEKKYLDRNESCFQIVLSQNFQ
ncbi:MAG: SAM-dependent methyltransferase [Bdellovibrionales bacterium]